MAKYVLEIHRAWLYLVRGTPRIPMSLPYSSLPQAMVVEVMLLQVTVCMFPVELTTVRHLVNNSRSSGHRQIIFVEEPVVPVELSLQGETCFLTEVMSKTPGTGWKRKIMR